MQIVTWLVVIGFGTLLLAAYLELRPKFENFRLKTQEESKIDDTVAEEEVVEVINVPVEPQAPIDFGFKQGFKFAFGFWIGTFCLGLLCFLFFGGLISTYLHNSVQSGLIPR